MSTSRITLTLAAILLIGALVALLLQQRDLTTSREAQARLEKQVQQLTAENAAQATARATAENTLALARVELAAQSRRTQLPSTATATAPAPNVSTAPLTPNLVAGSPLPVSLNTAKERSRLHARYDAFLFQERHLTPAQAERMIDLWIAQNEARADLQAAVEQQGLTAGPAVEALRGKLYTPLTTEMRQILGEDGYAAYHDYETSSYYRLAFVAPLAPQFASAGAPLSDQQQLQLSRLIATYDHPQQIKPTDLSSRSQIDWDGVVRSAGGILSPTQAAVIQAYARQKTGGR